MIDSKDVLVIFSEELGFKMKLKGVTYKQVALSTRTTNSEILKYLSGKSFPELWSVVLIAGYLDCSVNELLGFPATVYSRVDGNNDAASEFPTRESFCDYFRDRLRLLMAYGEISTEELSERTRIKKETIEMYLSVHRWIPRVPEFLNICSALECTPSDLLGY